MTWLSQLWFDILLPISDILLIAFVFYRLLLLIKGTHAAQVIMGLGVLMGMTIVVRNILKLPASSWLLEIFWTSAVVILAVVFQPELRTALAHLASWPVGRLLLTNQLGFIEEVVAAVKEAMERQIGMLIVLEQDVGLRNFAETGTIINGEVSRELLLSVFHYRAPLHDGAAMIHNARLVAAGCLLPLSNDPNLAKILGTRHRAAIGLSEFTDAWIIVVSEENGALSLARGGRLERDITIEQLRGLLMGLYQARSQKTAPPHAV